MPLLASGGSASWVEMRRSLGLATIVVASLALTGCSPFGHGSPTEDPLVAALRAPFSARSVDAMMQALARVGVGVYASTEAAASMRPVDAPAVPLKFLEWQARNLALDVTNPGAGLSGADLDALAPVPDGNVPTSYLLAAYVKSGGTAGARLARALMGNLDWAHPAGISFPTVVLVFLVADVARAEQQGLSTASSTVVTSTLRTDGSFTVSTLCTFLANWEDEVFATLFNLLIVPLSSNAILNFLGGLWNIGIGLVEEALKAVRKAFTAPVANLIRSIIAVIAVASEAVSLLKPVQVSLTANPPFNRYSNNPGTVTATLKDPDGAQWPQALQDCLSAFGIPVPPLDGPNHDPVIWTLIPPSG